VLHSWKKQEKAARRKGKKGYLSRRVSLDLALDYRPQELGLGRKKAISTTLLLKDLILAA